MTTRVIAVVNQKGGAGKSTLAMLLAGALAESAGRVLDADADPQNTALRGAGAGSGFPADIEDLSGEEGKLHKHLASVWTTTSSSTARPMPAPGDRERAALSRSRPGAGDPLAARPLGQPAHP